MNNSNNNNNNNNPNNSNTVIGQNTEKSPGNMRRLVVTPVKDYQLKLK